MSYLGSSSEPQFLYGLCVMFMIEFVAQHEGSGNSRNTPLQLPPGLSILGDPLGFSVSQMATGQARITVPAGGGPCTDPLCSIQTPSPPIVCGTSVHMDTFLGPCQPHKISCLGDESLD